MASFHGSIFTSARMFARDRFGEAAEARCLAALAPEDRRLLDSIGPEGWHPTAPVLLFHRQLDMLYGFGDLAMCRELGRYSAQWALNSFLRLFLRFRTPQWLFDRAGTLWSRYHDSGSWLLSPSAPGRIHGQLRDFEVVDRAFCMRLSGWLLGAVELTGGREALVVETRCRALGDDCCEFAGTWRIP